MPGIFYVAVHLRSRSVLSCYSSKPRMTQALTTTDALPNEVVASFSTLAGAELLERIAIRFASSNRVPADYQSRVAKGSGRNLRYEDNPAAVANCMIALDMSVRMNTNPLMVMQNLHVIEGRPSWSSQFIIAMINGSGKYSPLRFDIKWEDAEIDAPYTTYRWDDQAQQKLPSTIHVRLRNATCICWAIERATGERLQSAPVSLTMAVEQGWYTKNGSKWPSMPELMLQYRSAAFFGRIYAPEMLMGLPTQEEVQDVFVQNADGTTTHMTGQRVPTSTGTIDPDSGNVTQQGPASADTTEVQTWPEERFAMNLAKWAKTIAAGKPFDDAVSWIENKGKLTDDQIERLRAEVAKLEQGQDSPISDAEPREVQPAADPQAPAIDIAQMERNMKAAADTEALYEAAQLMDAIDNPAEHERLRQVFEQKLQELGG